MLTGRPLALSDTQMFHVANIMFLKVGKIRDLISLYPYFGRVTTWWSDKGLLSSKRVCVL